MKAVCVGLPMVSILVTPLSAQDNVEMDTISIFDELACSEAGHGTVVIHQSEEIRNLVGVRCIARDDTGDVGAILTMAGYRIQIFAGNDRGTSRAEAFEKENEIKEAFPALSTYVTYPAPFWRLRVGDFRAVEEARLTLHQLSHVFPAYAKDMCIVREDIRIPLY
jgi:hypothetical protein